MTVLNTWYEIVLHGAEDVERLIKREKSIAPCKRIHEDPGFRIPAFWIPDSKPLWIPDSSPLDFGFQQQKFAGFRIPDSLIWGETNRGKVLRFRDAY